MKTLAVLCSVASFLFTCMVFATDGVSREPAYIVFGALLLIVPALTVLALVGTMRALKPVAAACNVVLLAFLAWAIVDQYPHPQEPGFIPYVVLMAFTPALCAFVLVGAARRQGA